MDKPKDVLEAEAAAPVVTDGVPLPRELTTLEFVAPPKRPQYNRRMDGAFELGYIHSDDTPSMQAYSDRFGNGPGKIRVLPPGETPASIANREAIAELRTQDVLARAKALEDKEKEKRDERNRVAYEKELASLKSKWRIGL